MAQGSEYDAGHAAGRQDERLDDHADHLKRINGSIEKFANAQTELASNVRSLIENNEHTEKDRARKERYFALSTAIGLGLLAAFQHVKL
jgi:predicted transcriptional regulator